MAISKITKQDLKLAKSIKRARKEKGLTQEELADRTGVSSTWIGYIETGYRKPNLKLLQKISRVLEIKVRDIIPF